VNKANAKFSGHCFKWSTHMVIFIPSVGSFSAFHYASVDINFIGMATDHRVIEDHFPGFVFIIFSVYLPVASFYKFPYYFHSIDFLNHSILQLLD
jgi:hypothetical protein